MTVLLLQATYFDPTAAVPHLPITCGINDPSLAELSAVAISSAHLNGRIEGCGQCILLGGTGSGIGGVPVSTAPTKCAATDLCWPCACWNDAPHKSVVAEHNSRLSQYSLVGRVDFSILPAMLTARPLIFQQ